MILGMVGWRGMVGSVLTNRMREENDFAFADKVIFYSTSNPGGAAPALPNGEPVLLDANKIDDLENEIDGFESSVDIALTVSNSTTFVEVA